MFPIILAHGIARFDVLHEEVKKEFDLSDDQFNDRFQYFKNVRTFLEANGFDVFSTSKRNVFNTNVDFAGSLVKRAEQLKIQVENVLNETGAEKVHIIAHSMGGLDARMMIVDFEMADKVASLTTLGTPHFGTILADRVLGFGGKTLIKLLDDYLNLDFDGFKDLTVEKCEAFNSRAMDSEVRNGVFYQTYSSYEEGNDMFLPLFAPWAFIRMFDGRNDGLVPYSSQMWQKKLIASDGKTKDIVQKEFSFRADHLNQTGWWDLEEALNPEIAGDLIRQKTNYEANVKNIYLEIVQNLPE